MKQSGKKLTFPGEAEKGRIMERLTERSQNGTAVYRHPTPEPEGWKENRHAVLERCCQYEETGLEPEEIGELVAVERAKKEATALEKKKQDEKMLARAMAMVKYS